MKILHVAKFSQDKADGIRTVVPYHVAEQAKYEKVLLQNVLPYKIENLKYQVPFDKDNWPYNIHDLNGELFIPDLVIFHGFYHFEMVVLSKQLIKKRIPYIIVPHGSLTIKAQQKKRLKKIVGNALIFNKFLKNAKAVQLLSQDEYQSSKIKNKKFIGTNGIHLPNQFKSEFHSSEIHFIYIGRLDIFHKGLDLLIEAIASQKRILQENGCKFFIYGPQSNDSCEIEKLIQQKELDDVVALQNGIYGVEKERALLNADVFIQASRFEGMPMGVLEALSYGLPCLVTKGTTLGDTIEKYGAGWVSETNAKSIAENLNCLIKQQSLFKQKSRNSIKLIENEFFWGNIAKDAIENYKQILG